MNGTFGTDVVPPLQGLVLLGTSGSQGVALGWILTALLRYKASLIAQRYAELSIQTEPMYAEVILPFALLQHLLEWKL